VHPIASFALSVVSAILIESVVYRGIISLYLVSIRSFCASNGFSLSVRHQRDSNSLWFTAQSLASSIWF